VIAISASRLDKPFFCLVVDKKNKVGNLSDKKMTCVLNKFGIEMLFIDKGVKQIRNLSKEMVDDIRKGKVAVFAQGHEKNVKAVDWFIKTQKIYDVTLVLDEADAMLSSAVVDGKPMGDNSEVYNAHIRCIHFISATQLPTAKY
jgi:hypothetical protein